MNDEIAIPVYLDLIREKKSILNYILENCIFAYGELCNGYNKTSSGAGSDYIVAMDKMVQDYLLIRVGRLFDNTKGVVSFEKLFSNNQDFQNIKGQEIIKYIIEQSDNFVAHTNKEHIENNFPVTAKICSSNLKELLENLQKLLKD